MSQVEVVYADSVRAAIEKRTEELTLLQLAGEVIAPIAPQLRQIAELSRKHPTVLPESLHVIGQDEDRYWAKRPESNLPDTDDVLEPQLLARRGSRYLPSRRVQRHTGALRLLMEAVADEIGTGSHDSSVTHGRIHERADVGILPGAVISNTISHAVKAGLLRYVDEDRTAVAVTRAGWDRIEVYRAMPTHRVRVSPSTGESPDGVEQESPTAVADLETADTGEKEDDELIPLTTDAILSLLPADATELADALTYGDYDVENIVMFLRGMVSDGLIHIEAGAFHAGPPREKLVSVGVRITEGEEIRERAPGVLQERSVGVGLSCLKLLRGISSKRQEIKKLRKNTGLGYHEFNRALASLIRTSAARERGDCLEITDFGRSLVTNVADPAAALAVTSKHGGPEI